MVALIAEVIIAAVTLLGNNGSTQFSWVLWLLAALLAARNAALP